jgi:hypothetical protein
MSYLPLILFGVLLNAAAQLFLKEGMRRIGHFDFVWANFFPIAVQVAGNIFILGGLLCYIISVAVWLLVLSRVEVSYAYPLLSVGILSLPGESFDHAHHGDIDHLYRSVLCDKELI